MRPDALPIVNVRVTGVAAAKIFEPTVPPICVAVKVQVPVVIKVIANPLTVHT